LRKLKEEKKKIIFLSFSRIIIENNDYTLVKKENDSSKGPYSSRILLNDSIESD
jgi:hypothetical protein